MEKWHYIEKSARLLEAEQRVYARMCSPRAQINRHIREDIEGFLSMKQIKGKKQRIH
jgi:hypothetical protein